MKKHRRKSWLYDFGRKAGDFTVGKGYNHHSAFWSGVYQSMFCHFVGRKSHKPLSYRAVERLMYHHHQKSVDTQTKLSNTQEKLKKVSVELSKLKRQGEL